MNHAHPSEPVPPRLRYALGALSIAFYLIHGSYWIFWRGQPENLLWVCHMASCLIGLALIFQLPRVAAIGCCWLSLGTPLWTMDVLLGGEFLPTSMGTHIGGLAIGVIAVRILGMPKWSWLTAWLGLGAVQQLCRWITPASTNVNTAFRVWAGWEQTFPRYAVFWLLLAGISATVYFLAETGLRVFARVARPQPRPPEAAATADPAPAPAPSTAP